MKSYKLTITSNNSKNVSNIKYFNSILDKGILLDILVPITPYKINIDEVEFIISYDTLEETIKYLLKTKLKTKIAKNTTFTKVETLAIFTKKPNLQLNVWKGESGKIRTYVNNSGSALIINTIFPGLFEFEVDTYSKTTYYHGELTLEYDSAANYYVLTGRKPVDTVIYEEIILEK